MAPRTSFESRTDSDRKRRNRSFEPQWHVRPGYVRKATITWHRFRDHRSVRARRPAIGRRGDINLAGGALLNQLKRDDKLISEGTVADRPNQCDPEEGTQQSPASESLLLVPIAHFGHAFVHPSVCQPMSRGSIQIPAEKSGRGKLENTRSSQVSCRAGASTARITRLLAVGRQVFQIDSFTATDSHDLGISTSSHGHRNHSVLHFDDSRGRMESERINWKSRLESNTRERYRRIYPWPRPRGSIRHGHFVPVDSSSLCNHRRVGCLCRAAPTIQAAATGRSSERGTCLLGLLSRGRCAMHVPCHQ